MQILPAGAEITTNLLDCRKKIVVINRKYVTGILVKTFFKAIWTYGTPL
jgi:hypothetical protein